MREETSYNLVVGLGNPGTEYAGTRHNAGFCVIDLLLEKLSGRLEEVHGCSSHYWKGNYAGSLLILQKPETFMNLSGNAVAPLLAKNGLNAENLLVISDDVDLPLGRLRIRKSGSCGGHNGLRSIMESVGTESIARIRIGIGHDFRGASGGAEYVLSRFGEEEETLFHAVAEKAAEAVILILRRGLSFAMNTFNRLDLAAEEEEEESGEAGKKVSEEKEKQSERICIQ